MKKKKTPALCAHSQLLLLLYIDMIDSVSTTDGLRLSPFRRAEWNEELAMSERLQVFLVSNCLQSAKNTLLIAACSLHVLSIKQSLYETTAKTHKQGEIPHT